MQLPQISIDLGHINSGEMNQDGSTITITNEKGYIYEYRREINSSSLTVPPVVDHCKWVYTAYVCDCSKIPNTNSLGQHIICPCRNGFKWVNSACTVRGAISGEPVSLAATAASTTGRTAVVAGDVAGASLSVPTSARMAAAA